MSSLDALFKDAEKLYEKFETLGSWTKEKRITDYPCLGGDEVTPSHVFQQITKKYIRMGKEKIPETLVESLEKMKSIGCEEGILTGLLMKIDFDVGNDYPLFGTPFIKDINYIAYKSKSRDEFYLRAERLNTADTLRKQSLNADYENLKRIEKPKI